MVIKIHELLLFLLLLWLFVANLATGSWQPSFRRPRNLRAFRDARRSAYSGQPGGWQMMDPKDRLAKQIARSAAKQANVIASHVVQAFFKTEGKQKNIRLLFNAWSRRCISHLMHCLVLSNGLNDIDVDCYPVYLVEKRAKQGGQVFMSSNGPMASNDSNVDLPKQWLFMPCLAMDDVPARLQQKCASIVDPRRPEVFIRSYNDEDGRPEIYLESDLDYDPREPETFEKDASFIVWEDFFFTGFSAFESVSYRRRHMRVGSQGRIQMSYIQNTAEFNNAANFACYDHRSTWKKYPCSSCKEIHELDHNAPCGEYSIKTSAGKILKNVYCEMGLNDGGYTFLNPKDWTCLTNDEVQAMFTDKTSFLARARCNDSTQPYGVLRQLPKYKHIPLKLGWNEFPDYSAPINLDYIGPTFMFLGFLPASYTAQGNEEGLQVNDVNITYINCDGTPHNYLSLFPNYNERPGFSDIGPDNVAVCETPRILSANPSGRVMPAEYFSFVEGRSGGCGPYLQTITTTAAIGFR